MLRRLALVPFGILVALLILELGLQLGAVAVRGGGRGELPSSLPGGRVRVLCIGDSNTYGLYVARDESYPAQLEALWNASQDAPELEVVNLGLPSTSSSHFVRDLPRLLETFEPDLVLVLVGVNDFWTQPVAAEGAPAGRLAGLLRHSRLARAVRLLARSRDARELEIVNKRSDQDLGRPPTAEERRALETGERPLGGGFRVRYGEQEFDVDVLKGRSGLRGDRESLQRNLRTLASQARAHGTKLAFLSYPGRVGFYEPASRAVAEVAASLGAPFIDLDARFRARCATRECPELLFEDGHPNPAGYGVVAQAVVEWLAGEPSGVEPPGAAAATP